MVTLSVPEFGITDTRTLTQNSYAEISVPTDVIIPDGDGLYPNKMLFVTATPGPISVVGHFVGVKSSSETFTVLPTNTLGKFYIAVGYPNTPLTLSSYSLLLVSALNANTQINIVINGQSITRTLTNQYDSYQVLAGDVDFPAATDITGALVHADKPVAVMSGHTFGSVPLVEYWRDAMLEQIPPLTTLGIHYVLTPFLTHVNGYSYRIIATLCETVITITLVTSWGLCLWMSIGGTRWWSKYSH